MSQDEDKTSEIPKGEVMQSSTDSKVQEKDALMERTWKQTMKELLTCTNDSCKELVRPTANMCRKGHAVCHKCRQEVDTCYLCDAAFLNVENPVLKELAELIKFPCRNASNGCSVELYLEDEESHLKTCAYTVPTEHRCKFDSCAWVGKKEDLFAHVQSQHKGGTDVGTGDLNFDQDHSYEEVKLIVEGTDLFWMLTKLDSEEKKFYKCFQFIGLAERAGKFHYTISVTGSKLKVVYRNSVDNDTKDKYSAYKSANCAVVDFGTLEAIRSSSLDNKMNFAYKIVYY